MPLASSRGWPKTPLIAFGAAAGVEGVRLLLGGPTGTLGLALELAGLAALGLAVGSALVAALDARRAAGEVADKARGLAHEAAKAAEVIDSAGEAIIVIDDQATIVTFNRAAERMFGYKAHEMIGTSLERLMTEGAAKAHAAYLAQTGVTAMVEAARLRTIHRGVRKTGGAFTFELAMSEWSDAGKRMFTGVMWDVTDRERDAERLSEAETRFSELFEAVPAPLFVFEVAGDGEFVLDQMNRAAETLTGRSRFAVQGWTPDQLSRAQGRAVKRALLECLSQAAPVSAEVALDDGTARKAALTVTPMRTGGRELQRVLVRLEIARAA